MSNAHKKKPSYHHITSFDPIRYVKQLEGVGFTREQAEMQSETFFSIVQEKLVTKEDLRTEIAAVRADLKTEITAVRCDIKELENRNGIEFMAIRRDMELLRRDLKIWLGGMSITVLAIFSAIVTLIPHFASN